MACAARGAWCFHRPAHGRRCVADRRVGEDGKVLGRRGNEGSGIPVWSTVCSRGGWQGDGEVAFLVPVGEEEQNMGIRRRELEALRMHMPIPLLLVLLHHSTRLTNKLTNAPPRNRSSPSSPTPPPRPPPRSSSTSASRTSTRPTASPRRSTCPSPHSLTHCCSAPKTLKTGSASRSPPSSARSSSSARPACAAARPPRSPPWQVTAASASTRAPGAIGRVRAGRGRGRRRRLGGRGSRWGGRLRSESFLFYFILCLLLLLTHHFFPPRSSIAGLIHQSWCGRELG